MHNKTVFDNGVRVVTEHIPHARTVSFGIWVDVGSRDENELTNGSSHFVEHMLFKGTKKRSAVQISRELDVLGGMANAFTGKDTTCFYGTVLDDQLPKLTELFADFFFHSLFSPDEVERERQVILQEISMVEDSPEELIHEYFEGLLWGRHPVGNTVLGTMEVINTMDSDTLREFVGAHYLPGRVVLAAAGNVEHQQFCDLLSSFSSFGACGKSASVRLKPDTISPEQKVFSKQLEQAHVILGTYGLPVTSKERYALMLLNVIFGGNMSSRLFQEVREKRALAYSVHSYLDSYCDCGYLAVYLGVNPATLNESLAVIRHEIDTICSHQIADAELQGAKDYGRAGLFLAAENLEARMSRIARNELYFGRNVSFDEVLAGLDAVRGNDLTKLAEKLFSRGLTSTVLGPIDETEVAWGN